MSMFYRVVFLTLVTLSFTSFVTGQNEFSLSKKIAMGVSEFRKDLLERRAQYGERVRQVLVAIDSSELSDSKKLNQIDYIQNDFAEGGLSDNLDLFYLLPENHSLRTPFIETYVSINEDFGVDKLLSKDLIEIGVFDASGVLKTRDLTEILKTLELLDIQPEDKLIEVDAEGAEFSMLLAYIFEDLFLTIHNRWQDLHFLALDRMDRYPNVNNGNVIEFIFNEDEGLKIKNERWNKILIRNESFISNLPIPRLNSLHDNLTDDGFIFILHSVDGEQCPEALSRQKIIKTVSRAKFEIIEEVPIGCKTLFKFKSIKESH